MSTHELLQQLEQYLDAVPRKTSRVESFGPLTLFAKLENGWPYYARPTLGAGEVTLADLQEVRERQRVLKVPEAVEWVDETTPSLRPVIEQAGMPYEALPLMVLRATLHSHDTVDAAVRILPPDDPRLTTATAVAHVGFGTPGTATGTAGVRQREAAAAELTAQQMEFMRERMCEGLTVLAVAEDDQLGPLAVGSHNPVGAVTEIVGVATLPSARRRGLGGAVTARLVEDARARGIATIFLSAGSEDVARLYARLGFERVGTSCIAEARQD